MNTPRTLSLASLVQFPAPYMLQRRAAPRPFLYLELSSILLRPSLNTSWSIRRQLDFPINPRTKWKYIFSLMVWWRFCPHSRHTLRGNSNFGASTVEDSVGFSTDYSLWEYHTLFVVNWNICARLKITSIDAEPHGKCIPQHPSDAAPFLLTTTRLWSSAGFLLPVLLK